jgi:hypothetical protein
MLGIDKYGQMYLAMNGAAGNAEEQSKICNEHGISLVQWNEANAHYMAKMSDVSDMGQTAMALAKYMMPHNAPGAPKDDSPVDFIATHIQLYVSEFNVQMAELVNGDRHVVLQHTVDVSPDDEFLTGYVQGRVHMSINSQGYSIYGGVERVELFRDKLVFHFDQEGKERMKRDMLTVTFLISNTKYAHLERTLRYMYRDHPVLVVSEQNLPSKETWNRIDYDMTWDSFNLNEFFQVNLRPNLENVRATGKYNQHVLITYDKDGANDDLFESFRQEMLAVFEADYETVIAMVIYQQEINQLFLYTQLAEGDFMGRINEALCYLPKLPLSFSGVNDPEWGNYKECLTDYENK